MTKSHKGLLLVGDIGGTKTDLAVLSVDAGITAPLAKARFMSAQYPNLQTMVTEFLKKTNLKVSFACFAVAGPVIQGHARLTNLLWEIDGVALKQYLDIQALWVVNDLAAIAYAVPRLGAQDKIVLHKGKAQTQGAMAVIAPGTGLGEAFLVWDGNHYSAYPSEGGHADFAPPTPAYTDLFCYLHKRFGHVSYEMVCSGLGLPYVYEYYRQSGISAENQELAAALAASSDPTPLIFEAALHPDSPDPLCVAALEAFVAILGAEAGNLALKVWATGGVFLGGGIPPRILSILQSAGFHQMFCHKGRFAKVLADIPISVITNADVALLGVAWYAITQMAATDELTDTGPWLAYREHFLGI